MDKKLLNVQIGRLEHELFVDAWDMQALLQVQAMMGVCTLFELDGDNLCGYCIMQMLDDAEILRIGVADCYQGQGVGVSLMAQACQRAKNWGANCVFLEVRADNMPAQALYKKLGFSKIGQRKGYYRTTQGSVDAYILQKIL